MWLTAFERLIETHSLTSLLTYLHILQFSVTCHLVINFAQVERSWASVNLGYRLDMYIFIIIIKGIYIAQVRKGHKRAMLAEMAVWLRNCLYLYSYLSHN